MARPHPEQDYRSIVEQALQGVIIIQDQKVVFANQKIFALTGVKPQDLYAMRLEELKNFLHPLQREREWMDLLDFIEGKNLPGRVEMRLVSQEGSISWVEVSLAQADFRDRPALQIMMVDITARRKIEGELRESEARYRAVVESQTDVILRCAADGRIIYANDTFRRRFNTVKEVFKIQDLQQYIHADDIEMVIQKFSTFTPQVSEITSEFRMLSPDGEIRWLHFDNQAILDQNGKLIEIQSVGHDITDLKRIEHALQESETRYRIVAQLVSDYAFVIRIMPDGGAVFEWMNGALSRFLGLNAAPTNAHIDWRQWVYPDDYAGAQQDLALLKSGQTITRELRILREDQLHWLRYYGYPERDDITGRLVRIFGAAQDISQPRKSEEDLHRSYEELAHSVQILERRNREITLVSEMGDLLQSCLRIEEASLVFAQFAMQLFPELTGGLYLYDIDRDMLDEMASWGDSEQSLHEFQPKDCWALRRGRSYAVESPDTSLVCTHILVPGDSEFRAYQCVPMVAQGEMLGMLYLENPLHAGRDNLNSQGPLAMMVAERMGMALSNLKLRETLKYQATRDANTGLLNRRVLEETLERELATAAQVNQQLCVLMVDLDNFKVFNDTYGYNTGDLLISEIGAVLQSGISNAEMVFRYGGDQFTVLLGDSSVESASQRALQLVGQIGSLRIPVNGRPVEKMTASIGIAAFPQHGNTAIALLHAAGQAMIRAKAKGPASIVIS